MSSEHTIHRVPFIHLYRDLSYGDFFKRYHEQRDGRVYLATYSFSHAGLDIWWKLSPTSVMYIDANYEEKAKGLLRRFPLFEVYSVPNLHTKAVYFEGSGTLLMGSENIFSPESKFCELMLETSIPENDRACVIDMVFRQLKGKILTCCYSRGDIRIYGGDAYDAGRPFLPCHKEEAYWDAVGKPERVGWPPHDKTTASSFRRARPSRGWVYTMREYEVGGKTLALAFDRGYRYCGDLDEGAFRWVLDNCEITEIQYDLAPMQVGKGAPIKDFLYDYHPVAKDQTAKAEYWLGPVKDRKAHRDREVTFPKQT